MAAILDVGLILRDLTQTHNGKTTLYIILRETATVSERMEPQFPLQTHHARHLYKQR
jgi:hypothetical protein